MSLEPDASIATSPGPTGPSRLETERRANLAVLRDHRRSGIGFRSAGVIGAVILIWLIGALVLHLAERQTNTAFGTIGESLWNVWILIFSGRS